MGAEGGGGVKGWGDRHKIMKTCYGPTLGLVCVGYADVSSRLTFIRGWVNQHGRQFYDPGRQKTVKCVISQSVR